MRIKDIVPIALGTEKADVLLKNARIVNVFSGEIEKGNIALFRKRIAGIGDYNEGKVELDLKGMYVVPGLIDAHLHIESSMLSPRQFARAVVSRGTTTVIADPHEIANVLGIDGLRYMIESTEGIPLNVYIAVPSAVPATEFETSGARLGPEDMIGLVERYPTRIIALGEVMNFPGVLKLDNELITKIEILRHKYKKIDGHAPGLRGKGLNAYIDAFIRSDHESTTKEEVLEKMSRGMQVFIREGSAAKNFDDLIDAVNIMNHHFFSFCTDDRDPFDIMKEGHIDNMVRRAIKHGLDPIIAIRMATINTARYFNLRSMGAIAPGYKADMVVVEDLENFKINMVIKDSKVVVKEGEILDSFEGIYRNIPSEIGKIRIPSIDVDSLRIKARGSKIRVIGIHEGTLITDEIIEDAKIEEGYAVADPSRDIVKIAVLNRHTGSSYSLGFVKGTGIKHGAIAMSIGHDSHNLSSTGVDDMDMFIAIKEVEKMNGGIAVALNRKIISKVQLPIAGLMSKKNLEEVVKDLGNLKDSLKELGCEHDIVMTLSFVQLAVIPKLKITDKGLVDVENQRFVDLFT